MTKRRIYWETIKKKIKEKWKIITATVVPVAFLFAYLASIGAITITGHSGDMVCAGTLDDPCEAYINFTANEDIFIYKTNYDPYGRNTPVEFGDGINEWHIYRSWGNGWREIDLTEGCSGSWCGCYWCRENQRAEYSYVFRKSKDYQIKIVGYKTDPHKDVKWGFTDELDPIWYGVKETGKWVSPSDWLYVRYNEKLGQIETAYGNFTLTSKGIEMRKNGKLLGTLSAGKLGETKKLLKLM